MNGINTSVGPPTAPPVLQPAPGDATATPKLATSFVALLATLGSGGTPPTNVASAGMLGSAPTQSPPAPPNSKRRHDNDTTDIPVFAFGVPVTIAAIPVAGLTAGAITRPQPQATNGIAALIATSASQPAGGAAVPAATTTDEATSKAAAPEATATPVMPTPPPNAGSSAADVKSANTFAGAVNVGDIAQGNSAQSSAPAGTTTPITTVLPPPAKTNAATTAQGGQSLSNTIMPLTLATSGAATVATAQAGSNDVGVMATSSDQATNAVAAIAVTSKPARHVAIESLSPDGLATTTGAVGGSSVADLAAPVSPPHPSVVGATQQLVAQATLLHNGQSAEMQMRLRPPELGDVRVILRRDATGALSAHLIPATRAAGDVLNANVHHLRDALDQHSQGQRAAVSVGQHDVADQRQHMNGGQSSHEDEASAASPATTTAKNDRATPQRLGRAAAANAAVDYDA